MAGMTSIEMRSKGRLGAEDSKNIDEALPVTEVPIRAKSKQYTEFNSRHSTSNNPLIGVQADVT